MKFTTISNVVLVVLVIALIGMLYWVGKRGLSKAEYYECLKWQKEATEIQDYYITHWQSEQCKTYQVEIDAIIKN